MEYIKRPLKSLGRKGPVQIVKLLLYSCLENQHVLNYTINLLVVICRYCVRFCMRTINP